MDRDLGEPLVVWATVGKVGTALLSALVALFTLYSYLNPDKAVVTPQCETVRATDHLDAGKFEGDDVKKGDIEFVNRSGSLGLISSIQCTVLNSGRQEAKDVVIDVPFSVNGARVNSQMITGPALTGRSVNLGTLRPGVYANVGIWATGYVSMNAPIENYYSLSFAGGRGDMKFPYLAYGWTSGLAAYLDRGTMNRQGLLLYILPVLILVLGFLHLIYRIGQNSRQPVSGVIGRELSESARVDSDDEPKSKNSESHQRRY